MITVYISYIIGCYDANEELKYNHITIDKDNVIISVHYYIYNV